MAGDVEAREFFIREIAARNGYNLDFARTFQNIHHVSNGACCGHAAIPTHHRLAEFRRPFMNIRHDANRTT